MNLHELKKRFLPDICSGYIFSSVSHCPLGFLQNDDEMFGPHNT